MKLLNSCPLLFATLAMILSLNPLPAQALSIIPGEVLLKESTDANDKPLYLIEINGPLAYPMADTMKEQIAKLKGKHPLLVRLNSMGGYSEQGKQMISLLQEEKNKGRPVYTSVENGELCASMCVPIYMQGQRRYAGEGTLFMFHGATRPDFSNVPNPYKTEEVLQIMLEAGISKDWLDGRRKEGVFTLPGAYWIGGKELFDANANVVTKLISRHVVEEAWSAPFSPDLRPR